MTLRCHVSAHRRARGLTATALAQQVGISRQALAAIEASRSAPSTAVALALARELGVRVEDLFELPGSGLDIADAVAVGSRVVVGQVGGHWVSHVLEGTGADAADGIVVQPGRVEVLGEAAALESTVLVAGCAPLLGVLSGQLSSGGGGRARWLHHTSSGALGQLAEGRAHIAGLHLAGADAPQDHDRIVRERLPGEALMVVSLVGWREGLAVAPGNPRGIRGIEDLAQPGIRVGQRAAGSGAAAVLHDALRRVGLSPVQLDGVPVASHLDAASAIRHGAVQAAVVIEPVAVAMGLAFLPLSEERFELVLRARDRHHPGVQRLLQQLSSARFVREVRALGAYDTSELGNARTLEAS